MKRSHIIALLVVLALLIASTVTPVRTAVVKTVMSWFESLKRIIARHEGLSLRVYQDPAGYWTIGYGHLVRPGEPYYPYGSIKEITQEEAERLLAQDIAQAEQCVAQHVTVPLTPNQRAALVSFAYNVGCNTFARSQLLRLLNEGQYDDAAKEFDKFVYARGIKLAGLVNRRASERELFTTA